MTALLAPAPGQTLEQAALHEYGEAHRLGRLTVEAAWRAGAYLAQLKAEKGHGAWLPWLEEHGINKRTAQRFMQLPGQYPEIRQLGAFGSVSEALDQAQDIEAVMAETMAALQAARRVLETDPEAFFESLYEPVKKLSVTASIFVMDWEREIAKEATE